MSGKTSGRQSLRHSISSLSRPAMDMRFRLGMVLSAQNWPTLGQF